MAQDNQDVRWKQRFEHYKKAFGLLGQSIAIDNPSEVERAGLIQFFEMSIELAWKMLKDFLEEEGFQVASPRDTVKQAFQAGLIGDGRVWLEALKDSNLTVRTYEEKIALAIEKRIRDSYYPALAKLFHDFNERAE